jgi:hypothetical protein
MERTGGTVKRMQRLDQLIAALLGVLLVCVVVTSFAPVSASADVTTPVSGNPLAVNVAGNRLVNGSDQPMRLIGVDRSGTEYACVQGWGIFDGPSDANSVAAMGSWHVDAVRVPLNEDCWLGINGVAAAYSGANYRGAIEEYVNTVNAAGMVAILDLHWNAPGNTLAAGQQMMADSDHSISFWSSVATVFKSNPAVVFDLYNEPHGISWSCWRNGCTTAAGWRAAGMQQMLNVVRAAGATQPVMVAGLDWANDLSGWLAHEPSDPLHHIVASAHMYNFARCRTPKCWHRTLAPVAASVPLVTGELGENDCASDFIDRYMAWADRKGVSYLGWAWDTADCGNGPSLITSYDGTPTAFGAGLRSHLDLLATRSPSLTWLPPSQKRAMQLSDAGDLAGRGQMPWGTVAVLAPSTAP